MPDQTACPRCERVGLVRHEQIIQGAHVTIAFYCGACQHRWSTRQPTEPPSLPFRIKPRFHTLGPKRRG